MEVLLLFAFISGLITILAPCIWPLLPIILSSTAVGGKHKAFGVTLGIMVSFAFFTLTISYVVSVIPFDPNNLRLFAVIIIGFLGLTLILPQLSQLLEGYVSRFSGLFGVGTNRSGLPAGRQGFRGGFITGLALGIVWSPCAGPILATIATLAATKTVNFGIVLVTIVYVIGVGIPLFLFAIGGNAVFTKSRFFSAYTGRLQQVFGAIMILTALAIYTNYDKTLQVKLLDAIPQYSTFLYNLESSDAVKQQLDILKGDKEVEVPKNKPLDMLTLSNYGRAPEFAGIEKWLNLPSDLVGLKLADLRGRVVLIDFWTYTCINCIRTLPHVTAWDRKYRDKGLIVVGVHTPEFEFEKKTENVEDAIKRHNIEYAVAQDNDYATWNAYANRYWPAKYLIDKDGKIRYFHFGEGKYEETEKAIQELLKETGSEVSSETVSMPDQTPRTPLTPETYLGSWRMSYLFPNGSLSDGTYDLTLSEDTPRDRFSLGGSWQIMNKYAVSGRNAALVLNFYAKDVILVMRPNQGIIGQVRVLLDGKLVDETNAGSDVKNGMVTVDSDREYYLLHLTDVGNHILRLEFQTLGTETYAFTFG